MGEVFISHTSDMASFPEGRSFVDAAEQAVVAARLVPVDMQHFGARDGMPALYCRQRVRESDVYVGLIGLRYGSIVPGHTVSYTELEFDEATAQGKHRLIFLLDEDVPLPRRLVDGDATHIDAFRARLRDAGVMVKAFSSAVDLEKGLFQALVQLPVVREKSGAAPLAGRDAEFEAARVEYSSRVVQHYRCLDLAVLTPAGHDEHTPVPLRSVFVPQSVRADPPPVELPKELWRRLLEGHEIGDEDLPDGLDAERLSRVRAGYGQQPALPVLDVVSAPGNRLVMLLGDPGSGKSMVARYLTASLAGGSVPPPLAGLEGTLPLLVELRMFADLRREFPAFLDFMGHLHATDGLGLPRGLLESYLRSGGAALLIFDGLDELFDPKDREMVTRQIAGIAAHFPQIRVLVTSRVIGYRRALLDQAGFVHYMIQDLDADQIERFVHMWYGSAVRDRPREAEQGRDRLHRALQSPSIRELAGNPMLLTILTIVGRRQELPRERRAVYAHAAAVLIELWDVNRHLRDASVQADYIDSEDKHELLRRVAARMQRRRSGSEGNHIRGDELLEEFEAYLRDRYHLERPAAKTAARAMLAQFRERSFILGCYGADVYGFVHRAFLEYFCADEIVSRFHRRRELSLAELTEQVFGRYWADEGWQEVLVLVAGMIDGKFAAHIADYLVERVNPLRALIPDVPPQNVVLAIRCLSEVRNTGTVIRQGEAVLDTVIALLEYSQGRYPHAINEMIDRHVIRVFTAAGTRWPGRSRYYDWFAVRGSFIAWSPTSSLIARIAAALFPDRSEMRDLFRAKTLFATDWTVRAAAVEALAMGWCGDPDTLPLLRDRALHDSEWVVRHAATGAIAAGWCTDPDTFPLLCDRAVHDSDEAVRQAAVAAIATGWKDNTDSLELLRGRALDDSEPAVRKAAVQALATVWRDDPEIFQLLRDRTLHDSAGVVRGAAIQALAAAWPSHPDVLPLLRECAVCDDSALRQAAVQVIAAGWRNHEQVEVGSLLRDLAAHDDNAAVRQSAVQAVAANWREDPGTVLFLRDRAAHDTDGAVRKAAVQAIGTSWREDPDAISLLHRHARHDASGVVRHAAIQAIALNWRDEPETGRLLDDLLARDGSCAVRQVAIQTIAARRRGDPDAVGLLRHHAVHDTCWEVRQAAIQGIVAGWWHDPDTLPFLRDRATHDRDKGVRREAGRALAAGWQASSTLPWLRDQAACDESWAVRRVAFQVLAAGWRNDPGTRALLGDRATLDDSWAVRRAALQALAAGWRDDPGTLQFLHDRASSDGSWEVRHAAIVATAAGWRDDPGTLTLLRDRATRDVSEGVRRAAVQAIAAGWRERHDTLPLLHDRAARDESAAVRQVAAQAIAVGWRDDSATFSFFRRTVCRDCDGAVRQAAVQAIAAGWLDNPHAFRILRSHAIRDGDSMVRRTAVQAIAAGWPGEPATLRLLYDRAVRDDDGAVRRVALHAIAAGWRGDRSTLRLLYDRAIHDGYGAVRLAAVQAIVAGWPEEPDARRLLCNLADNDGDRSVRQVARQALGSPDAADVVSAGC